MVMFTQNYVNVNLHVISLSGITENRNAAAMVLPIYGGMGGGGLHPGGGGRIPAGGGRMPGGGGGPRIC